MVRQQRKQARGLQLIGDDFSVNYFPDGNFSKKALLKGLSYFKEGYIHKVKISKTGLGTEISAKCYRSMRKGEAPHTLHLVTKEKTAQDAYCSCTAGIGGRCSHMVGLVKTVQQFKLLGLDDVPAEQSCTSLPQTWHIPRGHKIQPVSVNEVVVVKAKDKRQRCPITNKSTKSHGVPPITPAQVDLAKAVNGARISRLNLSATSLGEVPLGSVLGYQTQKNDIQLNQCESMSCGNTRFPREPPVRLPPWYGATADQAAVTNPEQVEQDTRDQYQSTTWHHLRQSRITASNMHRVVKRCKAPTDAMLKSLFSPKPFSTTATDYGLSKENKAKEKYTKKQSTHNCHLHECGLVINNSFPFIAATPDAKVCDNGECGILEVKCPYLARDLSLREASETVKNFILIVENGQLRVDKSHNYYIQIQGQLLVTGAPWCDLAVYTTKDFFVERIYPNISFMTNMLLKLSFFFQYHGKPYLQAQQLNK